MERTIDEVSADLAALERDTALTAEETFAARLAVLDAIELDVLARIEGLVRADGGADGEAEAWQALRSRAYALQRNLEEANRHLFAKLRALIRSGRCTGRELERRLRDYAGYGADDGGEVAAGYDSLDALVGGLVLMPPAPAATRPRVPGMVYYQPTPARIVLDLVARAGLSTGDVFCDLGAGLGQVAILVHLLTGVRAWGVEVEPAYCAYARRCARYLRLSQVAFVNGDAREADLSEGTVFYLYTPFTGEMLADVLRRLECLARARTIRLLTYGPCTLDVARQGWLSREDDSPLDVERLAVFRSVG